VHHTIDARLNRIAGNDVRASDLIISSEVADGGAPRPIPSGVHYSETMYSIIELIGSDGDRVSKSRVTLQIAESESSPALVTAEAQPIPRTKGQRAFAALLRLGVLPPGEYVARAVVKVPGQPDALVTRSFRLAPIAVPSGTGREIHHRGGPATRRRPVVPRFPATRASGVGRPSGRRAAGP